MAPGTPSNQFLNGRAPQPNVQTSGARSANFNRDRDIPLAQGSEFLVNTFTTSYQSNSAVAIDADGDFVVTWHSDGQDGSGYGIYAQRYNASGVAQGSEFLVNTFTTSPSYSRHGRDSLAGVS